MFTINTERLRIIPLEESHLKLYISNHSELERKLELSPSEKEVSFSEKRVFNLRLSGVEKHPDNYMWNTVWLIVNRQENKEIGTVMIKNYPNELGEAVIGYSMDKNYRCKGYMTEALQSLIGWMFLNPEVKSVIADTLKDNLPSIRVLQKIGMTKYKQDEECFWWKLER